MNVLEAYVTKIINPPKYYRVQGLEWWQVEVEYDCEGVISQKPLYFKSREDAEKVDVGYKFKT